MYLRFTNFDGTPVSVDIDQLVVDVTNEEVEETFSIEISNKNDPKETQIVVDGEIVWSAVGAG